MRYMETIYRWSVIDSIFKVSQPMSICECFFSHHNFWIICLIYSTYLLHYIIILYSSLSLMIRGWWGLNYCPTGCSVLYKLSFTPFLDLIVIKANVMWLGRVRTFQLEPGTHMAFKPREKFRYWPFFLPFHASIYCMTNILEHAALHYGWSKNLAPPTSTSMLPVLLGLSQVSEILVVQMPSDTCS